MTVGTLSFPEEHCIVSILTFFSSSACIDDGGHSGPYFRIKLEVKVVIKRVPSKTRLKRKYWQRHAANTLSFNFIRHTKLKFMQFLILLNWIALYWQVFPGNCMNIVCMSVCLCVPVCLCAYTHPEGRPLWLSLKRQSWPDQSWLGTQPASDSSPWWQTASAYL